LKPAEEEDESGNTAWAPQEQRSLLKAEKNHLMHLTLMLFYQKALLHQQGGKWLSDVAHSLSYKMEQNRGWKKHRKKVVYVLVMIITMIKGTLVMVIVSTCRERINRHVLYNWVKYSFRNDMEICLPW
jgi:multisubunit Na+/H+ antiporter MnhE subunit